MYKTENIRLHLVVSYVYALMLCIQNGKTVNKQLHSFKNVLGRGVQETCMNIRWQRMCGRERERERERESSHEMCLGHPWCAHIAALW